MKKINSIPAKPSAHAQYQKLLTGKLTLSRLFWVFPFKISTGMILSRGTKAVFYKLSDYFHILKDTEFYLRLSFLWGGEAKKNSGDTEKL